MESNFKDYRVIFCGIARDNAEDIPAVLEAIEKTGELFEDYTVVVFENDSSDATVEVLEAWGKKTNNRMKLLSEQHNLEKRPNLQFLAYCRNQVLQEINKPAYDEYTHVIMADFDMKSGWPVQGVIHSFQQKNWDVIAANGIYTRQGNMWDSFPFRTDEFDEPYSSEKYGDIEDYWPVVNTPAHHRIYPVGSPMIPVKSAFGGLCIYNKAILKGLSYDLESEDCEHVSLHNAIRARGGRIFMNPTMIIAYSHFA